MMTTPLAFKDERNFGCRIREFVYRGHRCVSLENARVRLVVVADKGADILEFLYKPLDVECLWRARLGLRPSEHLRFSSPLASGHFREYFPGGWYEMLPNGPEPCSHRGAEFGFHGEATLLPWTYRIERDDPEEISVLFQTRLVRLPLHVERVMTVREASGTVGIEERVTNEAAHQVEFFWGHHPTFGWPLVDVGTRLCLPRCSAAVSATPPAGTRLAPNQRRPWPLLQDVGGGAVDLSVVPAAYPGFHDFVRLDDFDDGWFAIVNPARRVGFALRWDMTLFPTLGLWQIWGGAPDYPWYGLPYLLALEPACDLPSLAEAQTKGSALVLAPGKSIRTKLEASVFEATSCVMHVGPDGDVQ